MSIKDKKWGPSPECTTDDLPPFCADTPCWGCDRLFDFTQFSAGKHGLCDRCFDIVRKPA